MEKRYSVLIADIRSSKSFDTESRFVIQDRLHRIVSLLNRLFGKKLVLNIDFSSGDSIQGLFDCASSSIECFYLLRMLFAPYEIRCGIGIGDINDRILDDSKIIYTEGNTNFNDGNAYHLAKKAIDYAKEKNYGVLVFSDLKDNDIILNNLLIYSHDFRRKLTSSQFELMNLYEYLNPLLTDELFIKYETFFSDVVSFLSIKDKLSERNMVSEKLIDDLEHVLSLNRDVIRYSSKKPVEKSVFNSEITSRSTDFYLAKLFGVSPQNIALLRKRGHMNDIRTLEELGKEFMKKEYD